MLAAASIATKSQLFLIGDVQVVIVGDFSQASGTNRLGLWRLWLGSFLRDCRLDTRLKSGRLPSRSFLFRIVGLILLVHLLPQMPSFVKVVAWLAAAIIFVWTLFDSIRGLWQTFNEYGPSFHAAVHHWWDASPWRATLSVAVLGAFLTGAIFYFFASRTPAASIAESTHKEINSHETPKTVESEDNQSNAFPHIFSKLKIDSVEQGRLTFRITLRNGGLVANDVRTNARSEYYRRSEFQTVAGTMAPYEELTNSGSSGRPMDIGPDDHLVVDIYFDTTVAGVTKHNIATHRFPLSNELRPEVLDPESSSYSEGLPPPLAQPQDQFLTYLESATGGLEFGAPENVESGRLNIFEAIAEQRRFRFDAESGYVIFLTKTSTGRIASLRQPFRPTETHEHTVKMSWNNNGGELTVDGITVRDYDATQPSPTPNTGASPHSPTS